MRKANGTSSLAAVVVEQAIRDFMYAPRQSAAYRSAVKFLNGEECEHLICSVCAGTEGWRHGECPPPEGVKVPCVCTHSWREHLIMTFDWGEHRDLVTGAAGIDLDARSLAKRLV